MNFSLVSNNAIKQEFKGITLTKVKSEGSFSGWIITSSVESLEFSFEKDLETILNSDLLKKIKDFEKVLNESEIGVTYVHNVGFDKLTKIDKTETETLSSSAYATNQGTVKVNFAQWLKYNKFPLLGYFFVVMLGLVLIPWLKFFSLIIIGFPLWKINEYRKEIRDCYAMGNIIPGIVVHTNPLLIASVTDLSKGLGKFPVVRIDSFPSFFQYHKGVVKKGCRIPMLAIYFQMPGPDLNYWNDFRPWPVEFATGDRNLIGEKYYSISEEYWLYAESVLEQANTKKIGLTAVDVKISAWKDEAFIKSKLT
ncbi:MAG: DUF3239 domain-containing protein [Aureispira sp.]|nr:DUF3239 domain-containing protein [Aureispira sp.]